MRKRYLVQLPILACLCVFAGAFAGAGHSTEGFGPKISSTLASAATAPGTTSATQLHAIVYGTDLKTANTALGTAMTVRQPLGAIGGESVTIQAGSLSTLAAQAGVNYATLDPDIKVDGRRPEDAAEREPAGHRLPRDDRRGRRLEEGRHGRRRGCRRHRLAA